MKRKAFPRFVAGLLVWLAIPFAAFSENRKDRTVPITRDSDDRDRRNSSFVVGTLWLTDNRDDPQRCAYHDQ